MGHRGGGTLSDSTKTKEQFRVYKPHKAGLPNLREYFSELWQRRDFAFELSHTNMRAGNTNTVLGQAWLIVNPLLLSAVYYLLVVIIGGNGRADFSQITSGLFLFFFITGGIQACATSVTNAGSLILNSNFPKLLLIFSNVYLAFRRFLPTMLVYLVIHIVYKKPWTLHLLWMPVIVLLGAIMSAGIGALMATWHVYFRDTAQFLPYFIRIWLYVSPVIWTAEFFTQKFGETISQVMEVVNPLYAPLAMWADVLHGEPITAYQMLIALAWATVLLVGGFLYFMSREREFAVRL